jgi:hypothetical protein
MSQSASITQRIKIFNKIYQEMHNELDEANTLKYDKIKKYNIMNDYNKQITKNINMIIEKNIEIVSKIKLLKKYNSIIKQKVSSNPENNDVIFTYIKNLYYITFENKEDADSIRSMLDLELNDMMSSLFTSGSNNKLMKFAMELAEELKPIYTDMQIDNLEGIDVSSLIQDAMKGDINVNNISKNLSEADKGKMENLINIIKEKITAKIQSGELDINELKKMLKLSLIHI